MPEYNKLTEREKFSLARAFNETTGGKLSPYNSPQPVAVAIIPVVDGDTGETFILGGRRSIAPKIGEVALPGGFFEPLEHGHDAAKREVFEETGLDLDPNKFEAFHTTLTSPTNNSLSFFIYKEFIYLDLEQLHSIMEANATPGETSELVLISKDKCSEYDLAFPYHAQAVRKAFPFINEHSHDFNGDDYVPFSEKQKEKKRLKMR